MAAVCFRTQCIIKEATINKKEKQNRWERESESFFLLSLRATLCGALTLCAHCVHDSLGSIYIFIICLCVCVCAGVPAFMPCINVTMHHLCHLLSTHKCKIWVLLTQRLCPSSSPGHALWPTFLSLHTHRHKLPHTPGYRNRNVPAQLRLSFCLSRPNFFFFFFCCCLCWLMNFYSRPADVILIHLAGRKKGYSHSQSQLAANAIYLVDFVTL